MAKRIVDKARATLVTGGEGSLATSPFLAGLRRRLVASLRSSGGRPALDGAVRRQKIPMSDADWAKVEEIARALRADGVHATPGQVAAQMLHDAIAQVDDTADYPRVPGKGRGPLPFAERVLVGWVRRCTGGLLGTSAIQGL